MKKYISECCRCPSEIGCLGYTCPKRKLVIQICDRCGIEIDGEPQYKYGFEFCSSCANTERRVLSRLSGFIPSGIEKIYPTVTKRINPAVTEKMNIPVTARNSAVMLPKAATAGRNKSELKRSVRYERKKEGIR